MGYITQYGSSATYEDFVETLSCTITDTDCRWMHAIVNACLNGGVKEGDKVRVYELIDSLEISGLDDPAKNWNNFVIYKESALNEETGKYEETGRYVPSFPNSDHRTDAMSHAETTLKYERVTEFKSFRSFLDNWVEIDTSSEVKGINAILKKLEIATKWYTERWGLHLFEIRREVRKRQVNINDYLRNYVTIYDYQ